ncbi:MAG: hypothetical protein V4458_09675 [Pseudomonadota bacterium]|nr:hypothetical protein [Afipia sp.]
MRKILEYALVVPFVVLLIIAIAGAFVALFGALTGLENVKLVGGVFAGFGALGFFALMFSPFHYFFDLLSFIKPAQSHVSGTAQSKVSAMSKKEEK